MVLAGSGVIGVWGIGFFSPDLNRSLFRKQFEAEARERGEAVLDRDFVLLAIRSPAEAAKLEPRPRKDQLLSLVMTNDAGALFDAAMRLHGEKKQVTVDELLLLLDQPSAGVQSQTTMERERRRAYLVGEPAAGMTIPQHAARIAARNADIDGRLTRWGGYTLLMFHIGGFFGMYGFGMLTYRVGRRPAFAVSFLAAMFATAAVFAGIQTPGDVLWMMPILGLCQMTLFGGYAIYFPELFPTRLRSTGTSFAYNVGRFVAALGPLFLGALATGVFQHHAEPLRWACVSMSAVYLIGLAALPFAPETRGQPLPE
ncbi:MAG: MFS transporter [Planctomycetia bacterium]|nr:MFS transporter [Planctomycetia bacterium]